MMILDNLEIFDNNRSHSKYENSVAKILLLVIVGFKYDNIILSKNRAIVPCFMF